MRFTVQGKEFLSQLNAAAKVLNSKNDIAILDNFLITLKGDKLIVTSSDSENVLTTSIEVYDTEGEGQMAVNAKRLIELVKEVSNQPITFDINEETFAIQVTYLNGEFQLLGVDPKPFPLPGEQNSETGHITVPAAIVARGLKMTMFAVDTKAKMAAMGGVYWDCFDDKLVMVATNGEKLVRYTNTTFAPGITVNFILHLKTCGILNALIADKEESVDISVSDQSAVFTIGNCVLNCRFIKGRFPNYSRVIPASNPYRVVIDRQGLLSACKRVSIFATSENHTLRFNLQSGMIDLSSQDLDYGLSASEKIICDYEGTDMLIGFKSTSTQEVLGALPAENVVIEVSGPGRPALFLPFEKEEGEDVTTLLMPYTVVS